MRKYKVEWADGYFDIVAARDIMEVVMRYSHPVMQSIQSITLMGSIDQ